MGVAHNTPSFIEALSVYIIKMRKLHGSPEREKVHALGGGHGKVSVDLARSKSRVSLAISPSGRCQGSEVVTPRNGQTPSIRPLLLPAPEAEGAVFLPTEGGGVPPVPIVSSVATLRPPPRPGPLTGCGSSTAAMRLRSRPGPSLGPPPPPPRPGKSSDPLGASPEFSLQPRHYFFSPTELKGIV